MDNVKVIAIPIMGKSSDYKVSKLFARSPYFVIFDKKSQSKLFVKNDYRNDQTQSGKSISKLLVAKGVNVFCGFDIGFNVQKIAEENSIQLIILPEGKDVTGDEILSKIMGK